MKIKAIWRNARLLLHRLPLRDVICIGGLQLVSFAAYTQLRWERVTDELVFVNPPFNACHASSIVETVPNQLLLTFFGGTNEGHHDVAVWLTSKSGKEWKQPWPVADGSLNDSLRYPCWNPVLFKAQSGRLFLFYKVGPNPREWWGMVRTSPDNGSTWDAPTRLPDGIIGPVKNKPFQLKNGTIISPSSTETNENWRVHIEKSDDEGKNWTIIPVDWASTFKAIQPSVLSYDDKTLQLLCRSNQDRIVQSWSFDGGNTWSPLSKLSLPNPNSGTDAITLKNGWQLLVYNPAVSGKEWFNNRGKLHVAVSTNGKEWTDVFVLENGNEQNEFSYPSVIQTSDGRVHITYTYNRKNIKHVVLQAKE